MNEDFINNSSPLTHVSLMPDISPSMAPYIDQVNQYSNAYCESLAMDPETKYMVELSLLPFSAFAKKMMVNSAVSNGITMPLLDVSGMFTRGMKAFKVSDQVCQDRAKVYQQNGIPHYTPWKVIISDAQFHDYNRNKALAYKAAANRGEVFIVFALCGDYDAEKAKTFCSDELPPFVINPSKIKEMLEWLKECMVSVSRSSVGDKPDLPPVKGFADMVL